ncbi:MAG: HD domain-containing protein, partial [Clostridia bacterium]|nr:HD domain-containing protein [Clostridia bacterium]
KKALMQVAHPSVFFIRLKEMHQLHTWFPEIEALLDVPQSPAYHPEGDAWQHTMLALDGAAPLRTAARQPWPFMLSALLHDCGKAVSTTVDEGTGKISSIGHENSGVPLALAFMERLRTDKKTEKYVVSMIRQHMKPNLLPPQGARPKSYMRMYDESEEPEDLILLSEADRIGQMADMSVYAETKALLQNMLSRYRDVILKEKKVSGDELVEAGFRPGKEMGELLAYAHKLWLAGIPHQETLRQTIQYGKKLHH